MRPAVPSLSHSQTHPFGLLARRNAQELRECDIEFRRRSLKAIFLLRRQSQVQDLILWLSKGLPRRHTYALCIHQTRKSNTY